MLRLNRHHIFLIGLITALLFAGIHILNFYLKSEFGKGVVTGWEGYAPVVYYTSGDEAHMFIGLENLNVEVGDKVDVIFEKGNPENAAVFSFTGFFMRYFLFLIVPLIVFTAFVYSWFDPEDYVILNFRRNQEPRIQKSRRLN